MFQTAPGRVASKPVSPPEPIAIIGIGCRYPGGVNSPATFWQLLCQEVDAITDMPADPIRFDVEALYHPTPATPGKVITRKGGFLEHLDQFDANFFGISPREADRLDPQQRLLLEVAWEALEDAGLVPSKLAGSQTGVFIGMWTNDYEDKIYHLSDDIDLYITTGSGRYAASGRLSYTFDLQGPSLTVDTACSSSLVAIHLACHSLWAGETTLALAGGVNLLLEPQISIGYSRSKMLSPDGRCKFGDAQANGYVRSEGVGLVVLKPLAQAVADHDPIYALIRGSAVNNDGRSSELLVAPGVKTQINMLRQVYHQAGVDTGQVSYIEAHGTGTRVGDPVELEALGAVLAENRPVGHFCRIGSVKTNIGHTEASSGVAGLIKTALSLKHRIIPASLHFKEPNPNIPWSKIPFQIQQATTPWPEQAGPIFAGVNSFGVTGTNAHIVLQEPPISPAKELHTASSERTYLIPLSAHTPEALRTMVRTCVALFELRRDKADELTDLVYSLAVRRTHHDHRLALIGANPGEIAGALASFLNGEPRPEVIVSDEEGVIQPKVVFVFPGQGAQWLGMGRQLLAAEPVFARSLAQCEQAMRPWVTWSLVEQLGLNETDPGYCLAEIDVIQPTLLSIEIALAELWRSWGIEPAAVIGHSMGEVAAAYIAGALSLTDAMRIICRRSQLLRRTSGQGAMAVVELSVEEAQAALAGYEDRLAVAVSNSPRSTVLSGDPAALAEVVRQLESQQVFCRFIKVDVASHSPQMNPLKDDLRTALAEVQPHPATVPMYSTALGAVIDGANCGPDYWVQNLRQPVLFSKMVQQLLASDHTIFIEMSPHPILLPAVQQGFQHAGVTGVVVSSLRREQPEQAAMLAALGQLYVLGCPVAWERLYPAGQYLPLPLYPWQRERFWYDAPAARQGQARPGRHPFLQTYLPAATGQHLWEGEISLEQFPYLADHRVQDAVVLPAAVYLELILAAAVEVFGPGAHLVEKVTFDAALTLVKEQPQLVQVVLSPDLPDAFACRFFSRPANQPAAAWNLHGGALVRPQTGQSPRPASPPVALAESNAAAGAEHYQLMAARGLNYGPAFQGVTRFWSQPVAGAVVAQLQPAGNDGYFLPPVLLDACFQLAVAALAAPAGETLLPVSLERWQLYGPIVPDYAYRGYAVCRPEAGPLTGDVLLLDETGQVVAAAQGLRFESIGANVAPVPADWFYQIDWQPLPPTAPAGKAPGAWLILADRQGVGRQLAAQLTALGEDCVLALPGADNLRLEPDVYQINPTGPAAFGPALAARLLYRGVVYLWGLDSQSPEDEAGWLGAVYLAQELAQAETTGPAARLWLVTGGAQAVGQPTGPLAVAQAPLWGLGRVIAQEHANLRCTCLDLSPAGQPPEIEALIAELRADSPEDQVALRAGVRYGARLLPASFDDAVAAPVNLVEAAPGQPFRVMVATPGLLDTLVAQSIERSKPGAGEVEIRVKATGLNFMNVMAALGVLPGYPNGVGPLGIECAGEIVALGADVANFKMGDEVVAIAFNCLGSYVIADARLVTPKPTHLNFEEAASIPIVFLTAFYALSQLGRLAAGERVLIHAAAGGVGLAAVQLAQRIGAKIFATAGNPEKRAYLQSLGVEHVLDSRSLSFANEIMAQTNGEGVDVVLNSLAGEAVTRGLDCLKAYGRFLEIGKRDIYQNSRIGLLPFQKNLSYFAIDLDRMARERPDVVGSMLSQIMRQIEAGELRPIPVSVFSVSSVAEAFRYMAQGKHIGKIVISVHNQAVKLADTAGLAAIRPDGTYLITGGLGGLGLATARWLAEQGARHLTLVGRRAPAAAAQNAIAAIEALGARVTVAQADVSVAGQVAAALAKIEQDGPPLRGVIHAAGLLSDGSLLQLDRADFERVLAPKVAGAWHLHQLTRANQLDFFVLFSSVAALLGTAGQANYAAANAFLDALAHHRRSEGRPALSINWGPWSEIGLAAARSDRGERLSSRGLGSIAPAQGLAALARLLRQSQPQAVVMPFNLARWAEFYPASGQSPLFESLRPLAGTGESKAKPPAGSIRQMLLNTEPGRRRQALLEQHVREQVAVVLRLAPDRVPLNKPLKNLGLDSLMTLELRNRLEISLDVVLSATLIWNYPTVAALTPFLAGKMEIALAAEAVPAADTPLSEPAADLDDLSTAEVEALLAEELNAIDDLLH